MEIAFIILAWNSSDYIERCINSYSRAAMDEEIRALFIIVDNGSSDQTVSIIEDTLFPSLNEYCSGKIIKLPGNYGTTISRNLAIKASETPFIVICDSDTCFLQGSLRDAMRYLDDNPKAGILAPRMFYEDLTVQNSVKLFPTGLNKLLKIFEALLGRTDRSDHYQDFPWDYIRPVDTAISAFWMFKRSLLTTVGLLDEKIFYSPEDIDFCLRVWESGKNVIYYTNLSIEHKCQRLTHKKPLNKLALSHLAGLIYYFNKHGYFWSRSKLYKRLQITPYS